MAMTCCAPIPAVRIKSDVHRARLPRRAPKRLAVAMQLPLEDIGHYYSPRSLAWGTAFTISRTTHHSSSRRFCEVSSGKGYLP